MYVISTSQAATLIQAFFQIEVTETKDNQYKDFINIKLSLLLPNHIKNFKKIIEAGLLIQGFMVV